MLDKTPADAFDDPAQALPAEAAVESPLTALATPEFCWMVACCSQFCIEVHDELFTVVELGNTELLAGLNILPSWLCRYVPATAQGLHAPDVDVACPLPMDCNKTMPHGSGSDDSEVWLAFEAAANVLFHAAWAAALPSPLFSTWPISPGELFIICLSVWS